MANQKQLLSLKPYSMADVPPPCPDIMPTDPPETQQLQIDVMNVVEGLVALDTFPIDYQKKIRDYYRFYASRHTSKTPWTPPMIRETLDNV